MTAHSKNHVSKFTNLSIWYVFPAISIINLSLLPAQSPEDTVLKPQNIIIGIEILWFLYFAHKLRFNLKPLVIVLVSTIPLILLIQLISTWILANNPPHTAQHVSIRTVLKQIRDPIAALAPCIFILGLARFLKPSLLIQTLVYTLTSVVFVAAILQYTKIISVFGISYLDIDGRGFVAGFSSPNSLGAVLALIAPWTLCLFRFCKQLQCRFIIVIVFALQVLLLWITESRGSLISLILGLSIQWLAAFYKGYSIRPRFLLSGFGLVISIFLLMAFLPNSPLTRLKATQWRSLENDLSTQRRYIQLNTALRLFEERPLLGWGFGGFQVGYERYNPNLDKTTTTPHNIIMYTASQAGTLGLFIYLCYYLLLFLFALSIYLKNRNLFGGAILSFPFTLVMLELFFPYSLSHDVVFIISLLQGVMFIQFLHGNKNA
jgi:O-antigen ligase